MVVDTSIVCGTPEHTMLLVQGWIAFIVFCIGLPAGFAAIIYLSRRSLYCYAIEADVDECGSFVGNAQSQLQRYSCGTVLKMHAALDCAVVPLDGIPYTLLEVTNDDDGNEEMTEFVFTAGLVMVREKDDDNEVAAVQLGFGWMAGKYDSIAWWFEPWVGDVQFMFVLDSHAYTLSATTQLAVLPGIRSKTNLVLHRGICRVGSNSASSFRFGGLHLVLDVPE
jgi:hypothetical protein